ncbi:activating signal cointegrator 1 complex subunit 1 isoform X1 [Spodoptera litura]|uniref:Activating signal cointegrator 1 complex subunit 1 isoform X1 n=1 Tax=Spodoptera litura TaxID=69820 RepID=A0A9J7E0V2_SPOLT|nr:activating signal cointegrator 1 complex subunit 1 isoform X1 [Spodoptera litura]
MSDILRPQVKWIEGRCYRVNDPAVDTTTFHEHDLYENDMTYNDTIDEDEEEDDFEVVKVDNSRYSTKFHVSKHYLGSIIGKKGAIRMRIERDTKTDIKIPRQGQDGDVAIFGPTAQNVKAARRRINMIVVSSRMKQKYTHFISIPMNHTDVQKRFEEFKESVMRECPGRGLDSSLFIQPSKLHLTIGVMCLMDNEERLFVSKLLTEAKEKIIMPVLRGHLPLKIRLKGLSYMNDDPSQIDVLYGLVQEEGGPQGLIQQIADGLVQYFNKAGFMKDNEYDLENVKLHVTLINSKYRVRSESASLENSESKSTRQQRESFDGRGVLQKFADYDFGTVELTAVHLSQRHTMGPDGYYQPTCVVPCH